MFPIDHFFRAAQRFPDKIAVRDGETDITYADLARRTNALAAALQSIDPEPQTRVGICGYNTFEHLLAWLAVFASGKTWVPLNPRNGKPELDRICEVTDPKIVVVDAECWDKVDTPKATRLVGKPGDGAEGSSIEALVAQFDGEMPTRHDLDLDDLRRSSSPAAQAASPRAACRPTASGTRVSRRCCTNSISTETIGTCWRRR